MILTIFTEWFLPIFLILDQCVEAEILPGDTLAKVALRYNVAPSELKRVNNLLNEAEFHALKTIKVPAKADSLLTELLPEVSFTGIRRICAIPILE